MASMGAKRHASRSPAGERSLKRLATSSPEEGELDDVTSTAPGPATLSLPASLPPKPVTFSKSKVPFPFKRRDTIRGGPSSTVLEPKELPVAGYDRSSDERRFRDGEHKRKGGRGPKSQGADHWEPGYARGEGMSSRNHASRRDYPSRDRRERDRRSPSPYSTSRSPASPPSSHHREKHRLPAPRSPEANFSPPRRDYGVDRIRDRDRDRDGAWDRGDRDSRRYRDDEDDRHPLDRPLSDSTDRYYRPERAPHPPNGHRRGGDDREWTRRDEGDRRGGRRDDRAQDYDRDYDRNRRLDSYRPSSPGPPGRSGAVTPPLPLPPMPPPPRKGQTRPQPNKPDRTPPPPTSSPPPPPPPDSRLLKDETLPTKHALVSIPLKRPAAPLDTHSPPSMPLPKVKEPEVPRPGKKEEPKEPEAPKPRPIRRREPVKRTRKEEVEAYGHAFEGCGMQTDYEVTTKLGEGTFGEVHKAIHKGSGRAVALKRILMHNEKEGMPVTALREIKILKALQNPCIVEILDMFVVRSSSKDPLSVYMVFPYMDHDLAGLLENERVKLQPSHIKLYMKQLLEGTEYMHRNHILHRDMKAANLLISNSGSLKIADFGLARAFDANIIRGGNDSRGKERKYTNCVVTRWYRPPELLLGARQYGGEVDLWGIGCVLGEMFSRRPILPGNSDLDQLEKIWQLCGTPNQHTWPNYDALPGCEGVIRFNTNHSRRLKQTYESVGPETCDLLDKLLTCNPRERITAAQALDHEYFWTDPLPADPKTLPSYEASHEFDKRGHRNPHPPPGGPPIAPQMDGHGRHPHPQMHGGGRGHPGPYPGYQNRGPPPAREMFHTGPSFRIPPPGIPPPPPGYNGPSINTMHPPHHPPPPPYNRNGPYQGGGGRGPPHLYPRPGPGPRNDRNNDRWEPRGPRPAHLPLRPPGPPGRGGPPSLPKHSEQPGRGGGSELNYG